MRTSVIKYRVADFLKRYAPFSEMSDLDLLDLASSGRVVFHESEEYVFQKDEDRGPFVWVIQQGRVHLLAGDDGDYQLKDILGEGDILGLGRILGNQRYRYTAKTESDVILYSIDGDTFENLARRNPKVSKYLTAHFSLSERYAEGNRDEAGSSDAALTTSTGADVSWLEVAGPDRATLSEHLLRVGRDASIQEAARLMRTEGKSWIALTDAKGSFAGLVEESTLRDRLAEGTDLLTASLASIAETEVATGQLWTTAADYFLEMLRQRSCVLVVTEDGTPATELLGVIEASHLALATGCNPALLARELSARTSLKDLARLMTQATSMIASGLVDTASVAQSGRIAAELLDRLTERLIENIEQELTAEGITRPDGTLCWIVFGKTARSENFPFRFPELGAILSDSIADEDKAREYVETVLERVASSATSTGLVTVDDSVHSQPKCQTLTEWAQYFSSMISDPIGHAVYLARESFDFRALCGERALALDLAGKIGEALNSGTSFIPVLANDTMSNLPPLTFFKGVVVDLDGAMRETLDIEKTLLGPISDAARVLGLASRDLSATTTLERLERGLQILPKSAAILLEAAEAFRIASFQIARAHLQAGVASSSIRPSSLSRYDQRQLKNAFNAVQGLLELTATSFY